jgi:SAM-dependent methyltransferase
MKNIYGTGRAAHRSGRARGVVLAVGCLLAIAMLAAAVVLQYQSRQIPIHSPPEPRKRLDTPFIVSKTNIVDKMVELAELKEDDVVYDLGCGDGRIVIAAAKQAGCRGVGFDIDADLVQLARENAKAAGVDHLVTIEQRDVLTVDLSEASVVMAYLLPWILEKLIPQFDEMAPGSRIISHDYRIAGCKSDKTVQVMTGDPIDPSHFVHLWVAPLKKGTAPK